MIPVVTVVAFTLMGIEGIADEIEMPFGTLYLLCLHGVTNPNSRQ